MKNYLKKIKKDIDKIKKVSNNIIMNITTLRDLKHMQKEGLFTSDQVLMIINRGAFKSNQEPRIWIFDNWKKGEY